MNNWCICWFSTHIFTGVLICKALTARRLYKSFGVKGLLQSQWLRHLSCGYVASRLLGFRVRTSQGVLKSVSCECCVLSVRGLCVGLITRPEEYYRVCI
jgi:hypothetical protein